MTSHSGLAAGHGTLTAIGFITVLLCAEGRIQGGRSLFGTRLPTRSNEAITPGIAACEQQESRRAGHRGPLPLIWFSPESRRTWSGARRYFCRGVQTAGPADPE